MVPLSLAHSVRLGDATVFRELNGDAVLLQLDEGIYYGLDAVGTRLWQLMLEHKHLQRAFDAALAEFDVAPEHLEHDLLVLADELLTRRLLVPA